MKGNGNRKTVDSEGSNKRIQTNKGINEKSVEMKGNGNKTTLKKE